MSYSFISNVLFLHYSHKKLYETDHFYPEDTLSGTEADLGYSKGSAEQGVLV